MITFAGDRETRCGVTRRWGFIRRRSAHRWEVGSSRGAREGGGSGQGRGVDSAAVPRGAANLDEADAGARPYNCEAARRFPSGSTRPNARSARHALRNAHDARTVRRGGPTNPTDRPPPVARGPQAPHGSWGARLSLLVSLQRANTQGG